MVLDSLVYSKQVKRLENHNVALQQRLNQMEEEAAALQESYQRTANDLTEHRTNKDQLLSRVLSLNVCLSKNP